MKRDGFDDQLTKILKTEMDNVNPSWKLKDKIYKEIELSENHQLQEVSHMKHFTMKKIAILAACLCLLLSTGAFAAGKIFTYTSHSYLSGDDYSTNWKDVDSLKKKAGIDTAVKKEFSNGYKFDSVNIINTSADDESGNSVKSFKELDITYKKGKADINLTIVKSSDIEMPADDEFDQSKTVGDVTFKYAMNTMKFVPADYKPTAQDEKAMEKGDYSISYGSDSIKIQNYSYVDWEKDGYHYSFGVFDTNLTADELINMAAETLE